MNLTAPTSVMKTPQTRGSTSISTALRGFTQLNPATRGSQGTQTTRASTESTGEQRQRILDILQSALDLLEEEDLLK